MKKAIRRNEVVITYENINKSRAYAPLVFPPADENSEVSKLTRRWRDRAKQGESAVRELTDSTDYYAYKRERFEPTNPLTAYYDMTVISLPLQKMFESDTLGTCIE